MSNQDSGGFDAHLLVVGGGMAGITTAVETAEVGRKAVIVEKNPYLGGRVAQMNLYFPKLCPPSCGLEINLRRIKQNPNIEYYTLSSIEKVSGEPGDYEVEIKVNPRYVNGKCTACGECEKVCEIEVDNPFNFGMDKVKAIHLPHDHAFPHLYVVDSESASDLLMKACADACEYGAVELDQQPRTITLKVQSIVWATGWSPYDAGKIENLGFGKYPDVLTNVMMERMASTSGPTKGKITRPSDGKEIGSVAFVQCAGSRDENYLEYCSGVCCLASMKQATYIREQYPEAEINIFYIDVRSPGRMEDFYVKVDEDEKIHFHRGKVAEVKDVPGAGKLMVAAENTLTGDIQEVEVDLVVLATGMVPNTASEKPPVEMNLDDNGFIVNGNGGGVIGAGTAVRPIDVASTVQESTGAALKAMQYQERRP